MPTAIYSLPVVEAPREELSRSDFVPFKALNTLPAAMTAHILFRHIDATHPSTLSPTSSSR